MIKPVSRERNGFALLVVFLMAAAVAITLMLEIPRVAFESQRNREEMLVERGESYKRAVELYYRKTKTYPQKIEDLENTNNFRFLRKRYKDPLTGKDEWRIIHMGPTGLTDSLVEKMPGLDGDKNKGTDKEKADKAKEIAAAGGDPNAPKGPDDVASSANRTERDQRALLAQRGGAGAGAFGQPGDPNAPPVDPNLAFQQQQAAEFARQQQLMQQQQQQGGQQQQNGTTIPPDPNNPGAAPMSQMNNGQQQPGQQQTQPSNSNDPFAPPQNGQPSPFGGNQPGFTNNGSGPVRTLYPASGQLPFNPGNAIVRGAIPNPGGTVANSQTGGFSQPFGQQPQSPSQSLFNGSNGGSGSGANSSFNVPQAVRDQLTRPSGRAQSALGGNQSFGGGGIAGVASNAAGTGIKRYNEHSKYKEWEFVFDYRKPAKGAQKGVTGVGGLKTTDNPQQQQNGFGTPNSGFGNSGSSGFGNSGFGTPPRQP